MNNPQKISPARNGGLQQGDGKWNNDNLSSTRKKVKNRLSEYIRAKGIEITSTGYISCPWHDDKNPSCKVNDDYVHCFSCNESGDIYKLAAALTGVPCDKEHFCEIANEVERTLGIPEWKPPKRSMRNPPGFKLSQSTVFWNELLRDFATALDAGDIERAYDRAYLLFGLHMLPEAKPEQKKPTLQNKIAAYGIKRTHV